MERTLYGGLALIVLLCGALFTVAHAPILPKKTHSPRTPSRGVQHRRLCRRERSWPWWKAIHWLQRATTLSV